MSQKIRVRFAPSPTGGLHLGGVRTILFNYLFAKQNHGDFILRIEDTDQSRYVAGAEEYIAECLNWCGLQPDESPLRGGEYGPYRQSERKEIYRNYAEQLVNGGYAYYAFDTPEELEIKRREIHNFQYGLGTRVQMRNSFTLPVEEVQSLLQKNTPHVIRIKIPDAENIYLHDMIRGEVHFNTGVLDDKVLLKADNMPTYHLAVVVDDFLMKITHVFRGEEWLPSAPVHLLLWRYLFGEKNMPQWAHLPLILKPDGNGKLSKRDGDRLGFPVYAMNWADPATGLIIKGFRELGFLPEAFINMLALIGWNDGTEQEIFSLQELIEKFSIERVHKGGAKFNFEKAKWFNHEWIKKLPVDSWQLIVKKLLQEKGLNILDEEKFIQVLELVKDRCTLLTDFYDQAIFFFVAPEKYDIASAQKKWDENKKQFFADWLMELNILNSFSAEEIENSLKHLAAEKNIKPAELMLPLRIMLVGGKFGPSIFHIAEILGQKETMYRIEKAFTLF